jgi:hypothetical protein
MLLPTKRKEVLVEKKHPARHGRTLRATATPSSIAGASLVSMTTPTAFAPASASASASAVAFAFAPASASRPVSSAGSATSTASASVANPTRSSLAVIPGEEKRLDVSDACAKQQTALPAKRQTGLAKHTDTQRRLDKEALLALLDRQQIPRTYVSSLERIQDHRLLLVVDDSGSMVKPIHSPLGALVRRWDEAKYIAKQIAALGILLDPVHGIELHFLNRGTIKQVTADAQVSAAFESEPKGVTPLADVFASILKEQVSPRLHTKSMLLLVITDGIPTTKDGTDDPDTFESILRARQPMDRIVVNFLACTDDAKTIRYLNHLRSTIPYVDVTDDYETERDLFVAQGLAATSKTKPAFTYGDYMMKAFLGTYFPGHDPANDTESLSDTPPASASRPRSRSFSVANKSSSEQTSKKCILC